MIVNGGAEQEEAVDRRRGEVVGERLQRDARAERVRRHHNLT